MKGTILAGAVCVATMPGLALTDAAPMTTGTAASSLAEPASQPTIAHRKLPAGFSDRLVHRVVSPTALAWTPDGRLLVTSKPGRVVVFERGRRREALDVASRICNQIERGLVGIAIDPRFQQNHFIYLYGTYRARGSCSQAGGRLPVNRVTRYVLRDDNRILRKSGRVIVDNIRSPQAHHTGGDLEFGTDGYLYITVGDAVCEPGRPICGAVNRNSLNLRLPFGKILRVNRNGMPPASNPYVDRRDSRRCTRPGGSPLTAGPCQEIFASGFRNPYRFARKPGTSTFFVNDVGEHLWEEVNRLKKAGRYGWSLREGNCAVGSTTNCGPVPGFVGPLHAYRHTRCRAVTGGAFVPKGLWPGMNGSYLFADYTCGKIFRLVRTAGGRWKRSVFTDDLAGPSHLRFGPFGGSRALYYLNHFSGEIRRIALTRTNSPPIANFDYRPAGLVVALDGRASDDADSGDRVATWRWTFGDGEEVVTQVPRVTHTYAATQSFPVTLVVTDTHGRQSNPRTRTVFAGEHPPSIAITSPTVRARFRVGQPITVAAEAMDPEDGVLAGTNIRWTLQLHHANHFHPYAGPRTGTSISSRFPAPEAPDATRNSMLVAIATATDSRGLTTTVRQQLLPRKVLMTFASRPVGIRLVIQGNVRKAPASITSWANWVFRVAAPRSQKVAGRTFVFDHWSHGRRRTHNLRTPGRASAYTAVYRRP